jgi:anti-sigma B factor antagonist
MTTADIHQLSIESVSTSEGFRVIRLSGWVTAKNNLQVEEAIDQARGMNAVLDMTAVPYVDSAGLGSLLRGYVACQKYGGQFVLAGPVPRVRDLLQLTKVASLFPTFSTVDEAVSSLAKK